MEGPHYFPPPSPIRFGAAKRPGCADPYGRVQPNGVKERRFLERSTLRSMQHVSIPRSTAIVRHKRLVTGDIRLVDLGACDQRPALVHATLADRPDYIAISYCWGNENCLHRFEINGQVLILTSSLFLIFLELQWRGYKGKVWADGVCIDQGNDDEKQAQIPLMGEIYRNAKEVLAWLGSGRHSPSLERPDLYELGKFGSPGSPENKSLWSELDKIEFTDFSDFLWTYEYPSAAQSTMWNELAEMLASSWFERLWTLQEAILSDRLTIGYGAITISWEWFHNIQKVLHILNFEDFWRIHNLSRREAVDPLTRIHNIDFCRTQFRLHALDSSTLFGEARAKKATIAQDKVYALYSLVTPEFRNGVPMDLHASPQRVFIRAAKALIKQEPKGLISLSHAENEPKAPGLPSWVFDLNAPNAPWLLAGFCGYDAGQSKKIRPCPRITHDDSDDTLGLLGIQIDTISYVENPTVADFDVTTVDHLYWQKAQSAGQWIRECLTATQHALALSESQALLRLSRVMVCDRPDYKTRPFSRFTDTTSGKLQSILRTLGKAENQQPWDWGRAKEYYKSIVVFQRGRSFFITQSGYLGIGPSKLRVGDQLIVLYGGEVPFVVRKRQSGSCHELLGECYVDGLMEGQAMSGGRSYRKREQLFVFD